MTISGAHVIPLIRAASVLAGTLECYCLVGGLAVMTRLQRAVRPTSDVDTVYDYNWRPPDAVKALLDAEVAEPGPSTKSVRVDGVKVDLIEATPRIDLEGIAPGDDRLFVGSHAWALASASVLRLVSSDDASASAELPVASSAALVAMKLHAYGDRRGDRIAKKASDATDLYQLLLDEEVAASFTTAPALLRVDVAAAADAHLVKGAEVAIRCVRRDGVPEMHALTADELRYVAAPFVERLRRMKMDER